MSNHKDIHPPPPSVNDPLHPSQPEVIGQVPEYLVLYPIRLTQQAGGSQCQVINDPKVYDDPDAIIRSGVDAWWSPPCAVPPPDLPLWAYVSTCQVKSFLGEGVFLITASANDGQTIHLYLVTLWIQAGDGYEMVPWDALSDAAKA
ncbi:hypothetical protein ACTQ9L_11220 [Deinococcus wulumuqiensis]